jgi:hypothetical protein
MPVQYRIEPAQRVVMITHTGLVDVPCWSRTMDAVLADAAHQPGFSFLVDRRAAPAPSVQLARAIADYLRQHSRELGDSRAAIVVQDHAGYGMARMQEVLNATANFESRAFTDIDAAAAWLGIDTSAGSQ